MATSIVNKPLLLLAILCSAFYYLFGCAAPSPKVADELKQYSVIIGTGGVTGGYYPTGGAICKIINKKRKSHGINCGVESTKGSVDNINAIIAGDLNFGMAQSDRQYQATKGIANWKDKGPQKDLCAVFSIYSEPLTLVAAVDSGIKDIFDLKGKNVNLGNPGSGLRWFSISVLQAVGIDPETDINDIGVRFLEGLQLLQKGRIEAFTYIGAHPSGYIKTATSGKRKVRFIPITNIGNLIEKYPFFAKTKIPVTFYPKVKNEKDVSTVGDKVTFITSAKVPDEVVYTVTKEILENFNEFKKLHPAYLLMTKKSMVEDALSAPIHPGALRYYKEVGLK